MHIAVDLDGVALDFVGGICDSLRKEYGAEIRPEDITEYDLGPVLNPIIGRSWWSWLEQRDWLWALFPAIDGAVGSVDQLRRAGHHLELVTAKPPWAEFAVWKWMGRWRLPVHAVTIVPVQANKAKATTADVLIDDHARNCDEFTRDGRRAVLFSQPYNARELLPPRTHRANGWSHVLDLIPVIEEEAA
jgi:uncharacterized HAD superfamily protein